MRSDHHEQAAGLDEYSTFGTLLDGAGDPDRLGARPLGHGDDPIRSRRQQHGLTVAGVEPAGDDGTSECRRCCTGTDMIEHRGGQATMKPALPAPVLGKRMEQTFGRPGAVRPVAHLDFGMERAEEPDGLGVDRRVGSGARLPGGQTDRLRVPANRVAK